MNRDEICRYLVTVAAQQAGLPGNAASTIACQVLTFAARAIERGKNPVESLTRLADLDPQFDAISKAADAAAAEKFRGVK
jgi:hypothetical protein